MQNKLIVTGNCRFHYGENTVLKEGMWNGRIDKRKVGVHEGMSLFRNIYV